MILTTPKKLESLTEKNKYNPSFSTPSSNVLKKKNLF